MPPVTGLIRAVDEVAPAAQLADPAVPAEVSDADPLTGLPGGNAAADRVDDSYQFMPGDNRLLRVGAASLDRARVAVADTAGENAEPDVPRRRRTHGPVSERELS